MTDNTANNARIVDMVNFSGKVVAITGGAKGIGLACARRFAECGAEVRLFDRDAASLDEAVQQITADFGVAASGAAVDISDSSAMSAVIAETVTKHGRLDIWLNNAGIFPVLSALEITDDDFDLLIGIDLRAAFFAMRDAAKAMVAAGNGGAIINMVSVSGLVAATNSAHYVTAKHALVGATKAFARDLAPDGIRVLGVAPTLINTPGVTAGAESDPESKRALEAFIDKIPMGRAGEADEVARVVLFAASELAGFMTGSVLVVDGGELVL